MATGSVTPQDLDASDPSSTRSQRARYWELAASSQQAARGAAGANPVGAPLPGQGGVIGIKRKAEEEAGPALKSQDLVSMAPTPRFGAPQALLGLNPTPAGASSAAAAAAVAAGAPQQEANRNPAAAALAAVRLAAAQQQQEAAAAAAGTTAAGADVPPALEAVVTDGAGTSTGLGAGAAAGAGAGAGAGAAAGAAEHKDATAGAVEWEAEEEEEEGDGEDGAGAAAAAPAESDAVAHARAIRELLKVGSPSAVAARNSTAARAAATNAAGLAVIAGRTGASGSSSGGSSGGAKGSAASAAAGAAAEAVPVEDEVLGEADDDEADAELLRRFDGRNKCVAQFESVKVGKGKRRDEWSARLVKGFITLGAAEMAFHSAEGEFKWA